jgi:hypothetical protein
MAESINNNTVQSSYYDKQKNSIKKYLTNKRQTDEEYRKTENKRISEYVKNRYHSDPEYRQRAIDNNRKLREKKKLEKLQLVNTLQNIQVQ